MKKYKCIGLNEQNIRCWANRFKIGEIYEAVVDLPASEDALYLKDGTNDEVNTWYVDKNQFEECSN